ncbi:helix-turn-helix domain-containing protein [Halomonas urumqiensis]|uniref:AraC family transcriptional regulator n=1 Tax=Halomonas urumqiensis TaxID=1684789 RepID=A0A2N7UJ77_9GAMM|nr:helix-turn-helix domain-containing protein [Halomonas urumqiensis]PMR80455.1 AraC family transcriptional regulator [Halomonas urumqiensis]PTB01700.1 AraC family transcriptional regulator [Halomonas urumqiensis]GHE22207.1 AraC family transcriptional regulator [Halomonas urumqiensis]
MSDPLERAVPIFKLYGETQHWPTPDLLHCELIRERSGPHNWHIPPHRHADLMHLLYIRRGEGELHLEGVGHPIAGPNVLVVPTMVIHGFDFERDTDGYAITLSRPLIGELSERLDAQGQAFFQPAHFPLSDQPEAATIDSLVTQLHAEYRQPAAGREPILHALIQALAVLVARRAERRRIHQLPHHDKGHTHLVRYQALVEQHYREQPSIASLAARLGITGTYLNTLCQRLAGASAQQLLHERVMLEAKRLLTYTRMTVSQVADALGFTEPAYFTRFFKRHTGLSPKAFRQRQA